MKKKTLKIDLSYGPAIAEGFVRKDIRTLPDNSVEEISSSFLYNRIQQDKRGPFLDECYRVLVPEGKLAIIIPYWSSVRAIQDFGHAWPPVAENSFWYFNKQWREAQQLTGADKSVSSWLEFNPDYKLKCNFDVAFGYIFEGETAARSEEVRANWTKHYINAVTDLQVVLTKK